MSTDKAIFEKLKKVLNVSVKIKMDQMRDILKMDQTTFNDKIIEWAEEFGFIIDGDYVNVNKESVEDFINALDAQFEVWEKQESDRIGKALEPTIKRYSVKETEVLDVNEVYNQNAIKDTIEEEYDESDKSQKLERKKGRIQMIFLLVIMLTMFVFMFFVFR